MRMWRFALLPGPPFNWLNLQAHAQINVDPLTPIGMSAGKWQSGHHTVFGDPEFDILIAGSRRCWTPMRQAPVGDRSASRVVGFRDDTRDPRQEPPSGIFISIFFHLGLHGATAKPQSALQ